VIEADPNVLGDATYAFSLRVQRSPRRAHRSLLVLPEGDVGLGNDADEPAVLDNGQPPDLVAGHEFERLFVVCIDSVLLAAEA
jgi:hypothetical protein